jgi:cyclic pyranopterin phosphate synthase
MKRELTDASHGVRMIDVGGKPVTAREAVASGRVSLAPEAARAVGDGSVPKGDVLTVARVAGILAAKRTSELVPLCHPLSIRAIEVDLHLEGNAVVIRCAARAEARTGVEMEALTGVAVAALTVIDMTKGIAPGAAIERIVLEHKTGGIHGEYHREP